MKNILAVVVASTALSSGALADSYDWGGVYGGFSVGASGVNRDAKVDYNTNAGATADWNNGMYSSDDAVSHHTDDTRSLLQGSGANGVVGSSFQLWANPPADQDLITNVTPNTSGSYNANTATFNPVTPWLNSISPDDLNGMATAKVGVNFQAGSFVFGIEGDGSLLTNLNTADEDILEAATWSGDNTTLGAQSESASPWNGTGACAGINSSGPVTYGDQEYGITDCSASGSYSSIYGQNGDFRFQSSVDGLFTARARAGFAAGRAMFFVSGGLAGGVVSMSTSANVIESVESDWSATRVVQAKDTDENEVTGGNTFALPSSGSGTENQDVRNETDGIRITDTAVGNHDEVYTSEWDASMSKMAWGWTVGGGMSIAVTDNVIWTTEGYYYDLGSHSITAQDSGTGAEYRISQRFDGYLARTGLEWKF